MKKQFILLGLASGLLYAACQSGSTSSETKKDTLEITEGSNQEIPYQLASNYFIKNTVKDPIPNRIDNQEEFDNYFGMATTMGKNGTPTPIDFSKQYIIVIDYKETADKTDLEVVNLENKGDELVLTYQVIVGEQTSFKTHPFLLVIVDKNITGEVVLQQEL
ncbi:MAG: hypothetical protein ACRDE7_08655 [Sphingobacterium sp.]